MKSTEVRCARCAASSARFVALGAGEGAGTLADRDRVERTGWFGACEKPMPLAGASALVDRVERGELAELAREDPDLFGFVCRACGLAYCHGCWRVGPPEMDEGFYDRTRGTCPAGHEQTLDD